MRAWSTPYSCGLGKTLVSWLQVLELEGGQELVALSPHLLPSAERQGTSFDFLKSRCAGRASAGPF